MRFILSADLCAARSKFGGLSPRIARLSTVFHIGIAESVGAALSYRRLVGAKLQEKARKRTPLNADFVSIMSSEQITIMEKAKKEISLAIEADQKPDNDRDPKAKGKGRKGDKTGQPFQPRRFFARYDPNRNTDKQRPADVVRVAQSSRSGEGPPPNNNANARVLRETTGVKTTRFMARNLINNITAQRGANSSSEDNATVHLI